MQTERVVIGDATLYHGRAEDVLPTLEAGSIGVVITSPPYNVGLRYAEYNDNVTDEEHRSLIANTFALLFPALSDGARLYLVVSDAMVFWPRPLAEAVGLTFAQILVWCKPNLAGGGGKMSGDWNYLAEWICCFARASARRCSPVNATRTTGW